MGVLHQRSTGGPHGDDVINHSRRDHRPPLKVGTAAETIAAAVALPLSARMTILFVCKCS